MERKELTNEEIIAMYEQQDIINANFKNDREYGFDLDLNSMLLRCRNLKTQVYGLRVQAYFSTLLKYKTTPSSHDCGDFKTRENQDVEFKCSFIDKQARNLNIKQIRQWQHIDYYYCFTVDYSDYRDIICKCYRLTKEQMSEECLIMNAKPVHSTKKNNENNDKVELGITVKLGTEHFERWESRYLNTKLDLKSLSQERIAEINTKKEYQSELQKYKEEIERLKAQLSDKRIVKDIQEQEIIENIVDNISNLPIDIKLYDGDMTKFYANKNNYIHTEVKLFGKELEKKLQRIEAIKLIPQDWINELFDIYRRERYNTDFLYSQVTWKIEDMRIKSIKKRVKKEIEPLNLKEWIKNISNLSHSEATKQLSDVMDSIKNNRLNSLESEELDFPHNIEIDNSESNNIRASSLVY